MNNLGTILLMVTFILMSMIFGIAFGAELTFDTPVNYAVGEGPFSISSVDLDGDNDIDLAIMNELSDYISIFGNDGDGTFTLIENRTTLDNPRSMCSADFDGDGDYDLAIANGGSDNISIVKNNGDGTFGPRNNYDVGEFPNSIISADFDGDNDYDLAVVNKFSGTISILKNKGNGTFGSAVNYAIPSGTYDLWAVFSEDFNNDGDYDLVISSMAASKIIVLNNNGSGNFTIDDTYDTGLNAMSVFSTDLDNDNYADIIVGNQQTNYVSVFKNYGDGTFDSKSDYSIGNHPWSIILADLNNDGYDDLISSNYGLGSISIINNNGSGRFAGTEYTFNSGGGDYPLAVSSADFNGDGKNDIVVANWDDNTISLLFNTSDIPGINEPPTAYIEVINPNPAFENEMIYFQGYATDIDGEVVAYQWTSNIDGVISEEEFFSRDALSFGEHLICLKVWDNDNDSAEICEDLVIMSYFVHITDVHLGSGNVTQSRWIEVLSKLNNLEPPPAFIVCTGDLVEWGAGVGSTYNFDKFVEPLTNLSTLFFIDKQLNIPIFFCPGNHDCRFFDIIYSDPEFTNYHNYISDDYQMFLNRNCAIFSLNSGRDILNLTDPRLPEGDGLSNDYGNELDLLWADITSLDDKYNCKIIMTHHPYYTGEDMNGVFLNGRPEFINICDMGIDVALCGHDHDTKVLPAPPGEHDTQFIITPSIKWNYSYRKIDFYPNGTVYSHNAKSWKSTLNGTVSCSTIVHIYDNKGNHTGPDGYGGIERNIPYSTYSVWGYQEPGSSGDNYTEISLIKEDTIDYEIVIEALNDDPLNITFSTSLIDGGVSRAIYTDVPSDSGAVCNIYAVESVFEHILYIDDDADGSIDREVIPDNEPYYCGDVNNDDLVNILDVVYLINFKYKDGPTPDPLESADVNNDDLVNILDVVYLINYKYKSGPAPNCGSVALAR